MRKIKGRKQRTDRLGLLQRLKAFAMLRILRHPIHRQALVQLGLGLCMLGTLLLAAFFYATAAPLLAIPMVVVGGALVVSSASAVYRPGVPPHRVLVFGGGPQALRVGALLTRAAPPVDLVGYYASPAPDQASVQGPTDASTGASTGATSGTSAIAIAQPNLFRDGTSLAELVRQQRIQHIVVAVRERNCAHAALGELLDCRLRGLPVFDIAAHFEQTRGLIRRDMVSAAWLVLGEGFAHNRLHHLVKRVFDLLGGTVLLALAAPLMLLSTLAIACESGGPVLYRQQRVGLQGRSFSMLKFRSMRTDAEPDGQARWASPHDNRVTRVGRFMRQHRIDELPQLFNVLRGEMSLVGPRPERPCFVAALSEQLPHYKLRHSVSPGITGWAQVRHHYAASLDDAADKLEYDLYYVKNQCLLLDLVILFDTVGVVLSCKGAL